MVGDFENLNSVSLNVSRDQHLKIHLREKDYKSMLLSDSQIIAIKSVSSFPCHQCVQDQIFLNTDYYIGVYIVYFEPPPPFTLHLCF